MGARWSHGSDRDARAACASAPQAQLVPRVRSKGLIRSFVPREAASSVHGFLSNVQRERETT